MESRRNSLRKLVVEGVYLSSEFEATLVSRLLYLAGLNVDFRIKFGDECEFEAISRYSTKST